MSMGPKTEILENKHKGIEWIENKSNSKNIDHKNSFGYTPLALAIKEGNLETFWTLINQGADINAANDAGQSILFLACWHNQENLVKLLLDKNAEIDLADNRGWTPLMISVYHNYKNIVEILLNANCNIEYKDCFGKTPIERAKDIDMVILLQKAANSRKNKSQNISILAKNVKENAPLKYTEILTEISSRNSRNVTFIKSEPSLKPLSRSTTPNRSKMNATVLSDSVRPDNRKKIKKGMENCINSSACKFEAKFKNNWFKIMKQALNEQLKSTKVSLEKEAENLVIRTSKELSLRIKEILPKLASKMKNKSYEPKRKIRKIRSFSTDCIKSEISSYMKTESINDVSILALRYAEMQYMQVKEKTKKAGLSVIKKEINRKMSESRHIIVSKFEDSLADMEINLKNQIEKTLISKLDEIPYLNIPHANTSLEGSSNKYENYSFSDHRLIKNDIPLIKITNVDQGNDDSQNDQFAYIESITKNYEQYKTPSYPQTISPKSNLKLRKTNSLANIPSNLLEIIQKRQIY